MKTVLIVDDNPVITSIYRGKLAAEGLHTEIAADGEQGLQMLDRCKPDVVLLDLMLPKINGMDVLKQIRARPEYKALPVVVFSNSYSTDVMQQAWGFGATDVLHKSSTTPRSVVLALIRAIASSASTAPAAPVAGAPLTDSERRIVDLVAQLASGEIDGASAEFLRISGGGGLVDRFPAPVTKLFAALEVLLSTRETAAPAERQRFNDAISALAHVAQVMAAGQNVAC